MELSQPSGLGAHPTPALGGHSGAGAAGCLGELLAERFPWRKKQRSWEFQVLEGGWGWPCTPTRLCFPPAHTHVGLCQMCPHVLTHRCQHMHVHMCSHTHVRADAGVHMTWSRGCTDAAWPHGPTRSHTRVDTPPHGPAHTCPCPDMLPLTSPMPTPRFNTPEARWVVGEWGTAGPGMGT